jgi:chemotaxis protein MotB
MARKQKHEEHENHERWLISYADFITLLFAFFVVMYSVSAINEGKFRVLSEALVAAFRSSPKSMEPIQVGKISKSPYAESQETRHNPSVVPPVNLPLPLPAAGPDPQRQRGQRATEQHVAEQEQQAQAMQQIAEEIERAVAGLIDKNLITVRREQSWLEVEIKTSILFPSGSARLEPQALPTLREIAAILGRFPNPIRVEGFTDNRPINTLAFPSNWELSAGRAASVVHLFTGHGIAPTRMAAVGFGEHRPVASNATEDGRNRNRRVVLVVLAGKDGERSLDLRLSESAPPGAANVPVGAGTPIIDLLKQVRPAAPENRAATGAPSGGVAR